MLVVSYAYSGVGAISGAAWKTTGTATSGTAAASAYSCASLAASARRFTAGSTKCSTAVTTLSARAVHSSLKASPEPRRTRLAADRAQQLRGRQPRPQHCCDDDGQHSAQRRHQRQHVGRDPQTPTRGLPLPLLPQPQRDQEEEGRGGRQCEEEEGAEGLEGLELTQDVAVGEELAVATVEATEGADVHLLQVVAVERNHHQAGQDDGQQQHQPHQHRASQHRQHQTNQRAAAAARTAGGAALRAAALRRGAARRTAAASARPAVGRAVRAGVAAARARQLRRRGVRRLTSRHRHEGRRIRHDNGQRRSQWGRGGMSEGRMRHGVVGRVLAAAHDDEGLLRVARCVRINRKVVEGSIGSRRSMNGECRASESAGDSVSGC